MLKWCSTLQSQLIRRCEKIRAGTGKLLKIRAFPSLIETPARSYKTIFIYKSIKNQPSGKTSIHPVFVVHRWMNVPEGKACSLAGISAKPAVKPIGISDSGKQICVFRMKTCGIMFRRRAGNIQSVPGLCRLPPIRTAACRFFERAHASIRDAQTRDCVCRTRIMAGTGTLIPEKSKKYGCKLVFFVL